MLTINPNQVQEPNRIISQNWSQLLTLTFYAFSSHHIPTFEPPKPTKIHTQHPQHRQHIDIDTDTATATTTHRDTIPEESSYQHGHSKSLCEPADTDDWEGAPCPRPPPAGPTASEWCVAAGSPYCRVPPIRRVPRSDAWTPERWAEQRWAWPDTRIRWPRRCWITRIPKRIRRRTTTKTTTRTRISIRTMTRTLWSPPLPPQPRADGRALVQPRDRKPPPRRLAFGWPATTTRASYEYRARMATWRRNWRRTTTFQGIRSARGGVCFRTRCSTSPRNTTFIWLVSKPKVDTKKELLNSFPQKRNGLKKSFIINKLKPEKVEQQLRWVGENSEEIVHKTKYWNTNSFLLDDHLSRFLRF